MYTSEAMKNYKQILFALVFLLGFQNVQSQDNDDYRNGISDERLIAKKFAQTVIKLGMYHWQLEDRERVIMICENYAVVLQAGVLAIRNPTFENIKEVVVSNLLPNYTEQGTFLETIFDKELMRDVDQYVKYARTFLDYGLNMTQYDTDVRVYLSPEKGVVEEYVTLEGGERVEETFGGLTATEYQANVMAIYTEVNEYQPIGIPEIDDANILAIIESYFTDEEEQQNILELMVALNETEWTGEEEVDNPILQQIFEDYFENLEADEPEEEIVEEDIVDQPGNEGWNNGLNELMVNLGAGDRNVYNRYGEASEPYYTEHRTRVREGQTAAQEALTNVVQAWEVVQQGKYIEMAIEMEQIGREIIENGVQYDTSEIEEFYGIMRQLWNAIFNSKS